MVLTGTRVKRARSEKSVIIRLTSRENPKELFKPQLVRAVNGVLFEPILVVREDSQALQFVSMQFQYTFSSAGWEKTPRANEKKYARALGFPEVELHLPLAVVEERLLIRQDREKGERRFLVWDAPLRKNDPSSGVKVRHNDVESFYPLPQPSPKIFKTLRPRISVHDQESSVVNAIGPFQFYQDHIWFALSINEMGGFFGVGGYGYFDIESLEYHMHYMQEWADWDSTAFSLRGNTMWVGLAKSGDGLSTPGGAIRYDLKSGKSLHIEIPEVVHVIQEWQGAVFFGTDNGVWILDDEQLTQGYFTVDKKGAYHLEWETPISVNALNAAATTK